MTSRQAADNESDVDIVWNVTEGGDLAVEPLPITPVSVLIDSARVKSVI